MSTRSSKVDVASLRDLPVMRADMVVSITAADGTTRLVAREAPDGRFTRIVVRAAYPAGVEIAAFLRPLALSPDGGQLLLGEPEIGGSRILRHELVTGNTEELRPAAGSDLTAVAFAPDGHRIAALGQAGDTATVTVLGPGGGRRQIWSVKGAPAEDPAVSWSPDGRFLAVTYLDEDDQFASVVVDDDGLVVADLPGVGIVGTSRLAWAGEHELLVASEIWEGSEIQPIVLLDPTTGRRREFTQTEDLGVFGALDGRVLRSPRDGRIMSTAFDGSDPQPAIDVGPGYAITFFDALPGALAGGA